MLIENISLFWYLKKTLQENTGCLIHLFFFFSGGHLSTHCFQYLRHLSIFSSLFFMNNFCIATCFFSATELLRDSNKKLEHLFGGYHIKNSFGVYSQCRSKTLLGGSKSKDMFLRLPQCRSSAYLDSVYVILILRAWQTSHKGQQSLTKLNAKEVAYMLKFFLI